MTLAVSPLSSDDLDAAARPYRRVFNAPPWNDEWTVETARTRLSEIVETPGYRGHGASLDGTLVGVAMGNLERWYTGEHFHLKEMGVRPSHRRRGVGTTLLEFLLDELRREDVERVYLLTRRESPARAFYEANGFGPDERMGMQSLELT